ncbi:MAG TPA: MerR family transcriptional regulator [Blastocatellia bacterium]|nr:MerR family transcriptional regulator [Blastocatellia bacterium]
MSKLFGTTDVALRLGCSAEYVRQLERTGKLLAEKTVNGRRIFKAEDVERLAIEREKRGKGKKQSR